ncbi:protein kinase [Thermopolyspora sp. NPDC052614]|uniref:serine/threonine-protein kinase n=1 Tax=Thermopolyspora sp. NPDC052614 TaxID=3155682 RepID=UPI00342CDCAE
MPRISPLDSGDPREIGDYRLKGRIGSGGQGVVYLAVDPSGTEVAVKLLTAHMPADGSARRRFHAEIEAMRRVAPFCTAQVLDADFDGDRPYIVSEYVDGASLEAYIAEHGPRSGGALDRIAVGTATALAAIHHVGVVHRDFKPQNVLMGPDGLRVIDFGIARLIDESVTTSRVIVGTPAYMAPELISGGRAGPASDMFGWAATVAYAATGRITFDADSYPAVLWRIMNGEPDLEGLTGLLRDLAVACLAKDPDKRPTADEVLHALRGSAAPAGNVPKAPRPAPGPPVPAIEEPGPAEPLPPDQPAAEPAVAEPVAPQPPVSAGAEPPTGWTVPEEPVAGWTVPEEPVAVPEEPVVEVEEPVAPTPPPGTKLPPGATLPSVTPLLRDRGKALVAVGAALAVTGMTVGVLILTSPGRGEDSTARSPLIAAPSTPLGSSSISAETSNGTQNGTASETSDKTPSETASGTPDKTPSPSPSPTRTKKKSKPAPNFAGTWTGSLRRLATGTVGPVIIQLPKAAAEGKRSSSMGWGAGYRCTATITRISRTDKQISMRLSGVSGRAGYAGCFGGILVLTGLKGDRATVLVLNADGSTRMAGSARR